MSEKLDPTAEEAMALAKEWEGRYRRAAGERERIRDERDAALDQRDEALATFRDPRGTEMYQEEVRRADAAEARVAELKGALTARDSTIRTMHEDGLAAVRKLAAERDETRVAALRGAADWCAARRREHEGNAANSRVRTTTKDQQFGGAAAMGAAADCFRAWADGLALAQPAPEAERVLGDMAPRSDSGDAAGAWAGPVTTDALRVRVAELEGALRLAIECADDAFSQHGGGWYKRKHGEWFQEAMSKARAALATPEKP